MDLSEAQALAARIRDNLHPGYPDANALAAWVQKLPAEPTRISCYFCSRPASTMEAGYAVCEPMFHDGLRRRIETPPAPCAPDDLGPPAPEAPRGVSGHYDADVLALAIMRAIREGADSLGSTRRLSSGIRTAER